MTAAVAVKLERYKYVYDYRWKDEGDKENKNVLHPEYHRHFQWQAFIYSIQNVGRFCNFFHRLILVSLSAAKYCRFCLQNLMFFTHAPGVNEILIYSSLLSHLEKRPWLARSVLKIPFQIVPLGMFIEKLLSIESHTA